MFYPIDPGAMLQEHENRIAAARRTRMMSQEQSDLLDFTDYNRQRYAAIGTARARRQAQPVPPPHRPMWNIFHTWVAALRAWLL